MYQRYIFEIDMAIKIHQTKPTREKTVTIQIRLISIQIKMIN